MKILHKVSTAGLVASAFLTARIPAFAQDAIGLCPEGEDFNGLCRAQANPNSILKSAIQLLLIAAVVIALVFLIWGGIKWILSGGDKGKVEAARGTVIGAVIGLVIAFASFFILNFVATLFGLGDLTNLTLPNFSLVR